MNRHAFAVMLTMTLAALPAGAQEGDTTDLELSGQVNWTFGDRALAYVTSSSVYDTLRVGSGSVTPVNPDDTSATAKKLLTVMATETMEGGGVFSLGIEFTADPVQDGVVTRVDFTPDPMAATLWVNGATGAAPVTVTLDSYTFDGATGKVTGSFEGALRKAADWDTPPDPADCTAIKGSFVTDLYAGL